MARYISFSLIFFYTSLFGDSYNYEFNWFKIPVAEFTITANLAYPYREKIEFELKTKGPLSIYREYFVSGYIKRISGNSWVYYLSGNDRGQPEKKHIIYYLDSHPEIKEYVDDGGYEQISIDKKKDIGAIDPFTVLIRVIDSIFNKQDCSSSYLIMDGKRRYTIQVKHINNKDSYKDGDFQCRFNILDMDQKENIQYENKWPYKGNSKLFVDIWFSSTPQNIPKRFKIQTPIGGIVGKLVVK